MLELEGQIKMEEMCFSRFLKMGKDSAAWIELGRSFHRMGTVNEKVSESDCDEWSVSGNRRTYNTFNNKINKLKWKAAAPHGRLPHTKHKLKVQAWSSLVFQCRHSSFYSFRSSSVGLETGEWRRCRSLSFTPPASLRSHGSRPRPTRHSDFVPLWDGTVMRRSLAEKQASRGHIRLK